MFKFIAFACVIALAVAQPITQQMIEDSDQGVKGQAQGQQQQVQQVHLQQPVQTVLSAWPSTWGWSGHQLVAASPQIVHAKPATVTTTTTTTQNVKSVPVVQSAVVAHQPTVLAYPQATYVQAHAPLVQTVPLSSWAWPYTWQSPAWVAAWKKK